MKRFLLVLILTAPLLNACDFFQKKNLFSDNDDSVQLYQEKQDSLEFVDSIKELQGQISQLKRENQMLLDSVRKSSPKGTTTSDGYRYHVILGSFKNKGYLNSYNRYVKEKGFSTHILKNKYGFHMVAVEPTNNWQAAVSTLKELKESFEESAWIYAQR
ncbi:MAG: hypothetical protein KGY60_13055 [Bacteroidales bacterium]|nr:hypothetical protein [Bacteroidales bacterium]